ncbi:translocation/assembly module TamB domain-containing protein [Streptomyces beihaiensis]|uniref:Lipoprotein n=1 Tax=Streptomyces beihaiensis TaxID=2984495 RepID=A0ABT3TSR7_9ACTN|nr:hypothetical protein [Streptomyces beihaiensis]MCX3060080.1 hypothetical protein [Streptomyces beihaiensis]
MKIVRHPRRPAVRRAVVTASVLLMPLALAACTADDGATAPAPPSPAATASGARCVTGLPAPDQSPQTGSAPEAAFVVDGSEVVTPRGKTYKAMGADTSAVLVSGSGKLTTHDSAIYKYGDTTSVAASAAWGRNAAVLARDGGLLQLSGGQFEGQGRGATGVVAAGRGARAELSGNGIKTKGAYAHGVMASHGGTLDLRYVQIDTAGAQAAPIATGPGGAKVTVSGGTMTSAGCGSPGVQTCGDVSVANTLFDLANSEAFTVEPGGALSLKDVRASAAAGGVVLRGDGKASFAMSGGSVQASDGDVFLVERATADVRLSGGAEATTKDGKLLRVRDGGTVTFTADGERLKGDTLVSGGGGATLDLRGRTKLDGRIRGASLTLAGGARWSVADDSSLKALEAAPGTSVKEMIGGIESNGHTVTYDKALSPALGGRTYRLDGGGTLKPA